MSDYDPKNPDDFPYLVMVWLNETNSPAGYFNTPFGIMHIWWSRFGWEYDYIEIKDLPKSVYKEKEI